MKKKIIIVLVVLLAGGGFVAKSMFLKPAVAKEKIEGTIYILPKQFTANLKDGRYATLTVALVLAPGQSTGAVAGGDELLATVVQLFELHTITHFSPTGQRGP